MNFDDAQKRRVADWIAQGLKLADIQKRLADELGLCLTYMDVRLLVDDLKLVPKDVEPPKAPVLPMAPAAQAPGGTPRPLQTAVPAPAPSASTTPAPAAGAVSLTVDELARPGAVVSGGVTFSDGQRADWYIDQMGQLGVAPAQKGYKPPAADIQTFQVELEKQLQKLGF